MKNIILLSLLILFFINLKAGDNPAYDVSLIPEKLKDNANTVIRLHKMDFEIYSIDRGIKRVKKVVTILNKNGANNGHFYDYYDNFKKINNIKVSVYDAQGKEIKKYKKNDIRDQSISGSSLFDDSRIKYIEVLQNSYPYTVEYSYEVAYIGLLYYPSWMPQDAENLAIEKSVCNYLNFSDQTIRFKEINVPTEVNISSQSNGKNYQYTLTNVPAIEKEPYGPTLENMVPKVYAAPTEFRFDGSTGTMNSWKTFGEWINTLLTGRDQLSNATIEEIKSLTSTETDKHAIARKVYEYVQNKTRYVSIQLGIGGFQPFPASEVDEKGYGDCKALTNYTMSVLKVAGVSSYYAVIDAGRRNYRSIAYSDFPSIDQANHIILCVPIENDTIWLECTSQQAPFGYIGSFTADRNALLITEDGGKVVKTQRYAQQENTQYRKAKVVIDKSGNAQAIINTHYKGLQYENINHLFSEGPEEQKKQLYKKTTLNNFDIIDFKLKQEKNIIPEASEYLNLSISNYASSSGKRIFLPLNILNKSSGIPKKISERKTELILSYEFIDADTIVYEIPDNYTVDDIPNPISLTTEFGNYNASVVKEGNKITYIRRLTANKRQLPAEKYNDFVKYKKKIVKADKLKLVLVKEE